LKPKNSKDSKLIETAAHPLHVLTVENIAQTCCQL